jgi:hypothetical protein
MHRRFSRRSRREIAWETSHHNFETLYAFVVISLERRGIVHVGVTAHPTGAWGRGSIGIAPTSGRRMARPASRCRPPSRWQAFALAGIWEHSVTSDGKVSDACAIITGAANGVVAPLHDRMPLIVPTRGYARWLSQDARTPELLKLIETDASSLVSYAVNPLVNSAANDDPRCLAPLTS